MRLPTFATIKKPSLHHFWIWPYRKHLQQNSQKFHKIFYFVCHKPGLYSSIFAHEAQSEKIAFSHTMSWKIRGKLEMWLVSSFFFGWFFLFRVHAEMVRKSRMRRKMKWWVEKSDREIFVRCFVSEMPSINHTLSARDRKVLRHLIKTWWWQCLKNCQTSTQRGGVRVKNVKCASIWEVTSKCVSTLFMKCECAKFTHTSPSLREKERNSKKIKFFFVNSSNSLAWF